MADSGTKTEVSHGESVRTGETSGWAFLRPGVSCRERFINPQQPPEEGLHPRDTSVFVPEFLACGVLYSKSIRFLASFTRLSSSGDSHSCALALVEPRAHARCSLFGFEDTARVCPKNKSAGELPADLLVIIVFLRQLARRLDQLAPTAYAPRRLADSYLAPARANSQPHVSSRHSGR